MLSGGIALLDVLYKALPIGQVMTARLTGVNGFTGRGAVAYKNTKSGFKKLTVDLSGLAGRKAEIVANDAPAGAVALANGRASARFISSKGHDVPSLNEGARIDILQNGDVVLSGVLTRS